MAPETWCAAASAASVLAPRADAQSERAPELDVARLGPYRVLRSLGAGAFGDVFLCAQDAPLRRQVAVKVLRCGDRATLQQFALERQLLVDLQHEAIAAIYAAGTLPDGRPYFAMEFVDGAPITAHCDGARLSVAARVRLFLALCAGVQHAHQRGVIHRDLKPVNVLVATVGGRAVPKIIDFGVARVVAETPTVALRSRVAPGTPGYAPPEQLAGCCDTRADVFALGVILFELLAGALPVGRGSASSVASTASEYVAAARGAAPADLARRLRGDLDAVLGKALALDPDERYQSVGELARDLERHLAGMPVSACPPSRRYRLGKFVRRHRAAVTAGVLVCVALAAGLVGSLVFYAQAVARERAVRESLLGEQRARATAALGFDEAFGAADALLRRVAEMPTRGSPALQTLREQLLGDALAFYDRLLAKHAADPRMREEMLQVRLAVAQLHERLGQRSRAREVALQLVAELDASPPGERVAAARWQTRSGEASALLGRIDSGRDHASAVSWWTRAVRAFELAAVPEAASPALARACAEFGDYLFARGKRVESEPWLERAREVAEALAAAQPDDLSCRAAALVRRTRLLLLRFFVDPAASRAALAGLRAESATLAEDRALRPAALADLVECWRDVGTAHDEQTRPAEAAAALGTAIDLQRRLVATDALNPAHPQKLATLLFTQARHANSLQHHDVADVLMRDALAALEQLSCRAPRAELQFDLATARVQFAGVLVDRFRRCLLPDAEAQLREALRLLRALPAEFAPRARARLHAQVLGNLAYTLVYLDRGADAVPLWSEMAELHRRVRAQWTATVSDHINFTRAALHLAAHHVQRGQPDAALALAREVRARGMPIRGSVAATRVFAELVEVEAQAARARGDHAAMARLAAELDPWCDDWIVRLSAAEILWSASTLPGTAICCYRAAADVLFEATQWDLECGGVAVRAAPYLVVKRGQVRVRRAQLALARGDVAAAGMLARAGLTDLEATRAEAYAGLWRPEFARAARAVLAVAKVATPGQRGVVGHRQVPGGGAAGVGESRREVWRDEQRAARHPEGAEIERRR